MSAEHPAASHPPPEFYERITELRIGDPAPEGVTIVRILGSVQKRYGAGTSFETWYVVAVRDA